MKKQLLFGALFMGSIFAINAQTTISFESSEGFSEGNIYGQNGWTTTGDGEGGFIQNQVISSEMASQGTQSLKITKEAAFGGQNSSLVGAFYDFSTPLASTHYSVSADYYIGAEEGESNFALYIAGAQSFIARFEFNYTGNARVVQGTSWVPIDTFTWERETWYNVKIEVNGTNVIFYVDDVAIYTGTTTITEPFEHVRLTNDNWSGFAYVDNLSVVDLTIAGVNTNLASQLSVYPNPATNVINVNNSNNILVDGIEIVDLNGRTVKTAKFAGITEAQVNISDLAAGVYMMTVSTDKGEMTKKIVKN